jgi:hypothetical protein
MSVWKATVAEGAMVKTSYNPATCVDLAVEDLRDGKACTFPNPATAKIAT